MKILLTFSSVPNDTSPSVSVSVMSFRPVMFTCPSASNTTCPTNKGYIRPVTKCLESPLLSLRNQLSHFHWNELSMKSKFARFYT